DLLDRSRRDGCAPMSLAPRFEIYRRGEVWWMVDSEFEPGLNQLGLGQRKVAEAWIRRGHPRSHSNPQTGRGPTTLLEVPGVPERLHLRRTLHGGLLGPLWRGGLAGIARVRREIEVTSRLHEAGAPVPRPVLALAVRSGLLWRASVATVHLDETRTGLQWLASRPDPARRAFCARAVGEAVGRFHACGGRHADLHAGNILLREHDGHTVAWVIDLDKARMTAASVVPRRRELARLAHSLRKRSLLDSLDGSPRSAFLEAYSDALAGV
ncbi:MAG: lipopolysaccharide kinase InaA family protein, partial [Myxococcota bacterium]